MLVPHPLAPRPAVACLWLVVSGHSWHPGGSVACVWLVVSKKGHSLPKGNWFTLFRPVYGPTPVNWLCAGSMALCACLLILWAGPVNQNLSLVSFCHSHHHHWARCEPAYSNRRHTSERPPRPLLLRWAQVHRRPRPTSTQRGDGSPAARWKPIHFPTKIDEAP